MSNQGLIVQGLGAENRKLKAQIEAMQHEMMRMQSTDKLLAAALSGSCARLSDPVEAADFAIKSTNALLFILKEQNQEAAQSDAGEKHGEQDDGC